MKAAVKSVVAKFKDMKARAKQHELENYPNTKVLDSFQNISVYAPIEKYYAQTSIRC